MNKEVLHTFIEAHGTTIGDSIAVQQECGLKLTYRELHEKANQLAQRLIELGVKKGDVVGLMLSPGCSYVVSVMGVMKIGGVFMPIDSTHPQSRIQYMIDECTPSVILGEASTERMLESLKIETVAFVLTLARKQFMLKEIGESTVEAAFDLSTMTKDSPELVIEGDDPCYIMYTSGSTGRPKPILGSYKGLSHFIHWEAGELNLEVGARVSFLAGITFDVSLRDIFLPLFTGGTLCVPHYKTRTSPTTFVDWLRWERIAVLHCVPSFLRELLHSCDEEQVPAELPQLRYIMSAGEALYGSDVRRSQEHFGSHVEVVNLYGPSETTLAKAFCRTSKVALVDHEVVPLGKPIANAALLILKNNRLCSIGEIGEIYIKTPFRSKGYFRNPELTEKQFVGNPVTGDTDDILYKTGDLGRYLNDRSVAIVGRLDRQVKVNGIRIELEEIERCVREYPGVSQSVVTAPSRGKGEISLVAYYTVESEVSKQALRDHIASCLPAMMCPHYLVPIDSFPLNLNGKVNIKELPQPEELLYEQAQYIAPKSALESQLCDIWGMVLGLKRVGVNSGFLELGGDSLKAIRVVSRISKELGVDVTLKEFFASGTIRKLAVCVDSGKREVHSEIQVIEAQDSYPVSAAQRRFWILDRINTGSIASNMPDAFVIEGSFDRKAFSKAWEFLIDRHESLRTSFCSIGGEPRQLIHDSCTLNIEEIDIRSEMLDERSLEQRVLETVRSSSFDLSQAPLVRVTLFHLDTDRYLLLNNFHHIIADGWSMGVLVKEFLHCYESYVRGVSPSLTPLRIQYKDYASWQNDLLENEQAEQSREYWRQKLSGTLPVLQLPVDFTRPELQTFNGSTHVFVLPEHVSMAVKKLAQNQGASLYMVLLAFVKALLYRYTQQEDIIVGSPVAGRLHPDIEDQVGLFVNMLALRDQVTGDQQFTDLLTQVKQTTTEAFDHQLYPFDRLVEDLEVHRDMSRSPVYDVMVALQNMEVGDLDLFGLDVEKFSIDDVISRSDLTFLFAEESDGLIHVGLNYNTDLFLRERIEAIGLQFSSLVSDLTRSPEQKIADISLIDESFLAKLRTQQEIACSSDVTTESLVSLFKRQVHRCSENVALVSDSSTCSYADLDRQSDCVAAYLQEELACNPGDVIAIECDRSISWIVLTLGILKARCVYLPLDERLPRQRCEFMLHDSGATCVLVSGERARFSYSIPIYRAKDVISYSGIGSELCYPVCKDGAYIIYTSGSTGEPKGAMIKHVHIVNTITAMISEWDIQVSDCILQFASAGFDASLSEIFMSLLSGATLAIADQSVLDLPDRFLAYLTRHQVSVLTLPPVYLSLLNRAPMPTVRTIISAGEEARKEDLLFYASSKKVVNAYGPTECAICVSVHALDSTREYGSRIPIGNPIQHTQMLLLSANGQPVPVGVIGEICVAGRGVTEGYLNQSKLTEARFIAHPLDSSVCLYRTGDRGRQSLDGSFEYLGRNDSQVKVAGQRVELEEIAHVVRSHQQVHDSVVLLKETNTEKQLCAYIVPEKQLEVWPSVAEFYVYDEVLYNTMASHEERNARYRAAFRRHLVGKTVVEIGPGAEVVLSQLCIEAGAEKVFAIELLEETYLKAKDKVESLGLSDRIIVLHGDARSVELPEKVDFCISEIVGSIGGSEGAAEIINSARRFLHAPEQMLPQRSVTKIAAIEIEENVAERGFSSIAQHYVDEIFASTGQQFDLRVCLKNVESSMLLSTDDIFEDLDFTKEMPTSSRHDIELTFTKSGRCTGFVVWLQLHIDSHDMVDIMQSGESWLPVYVPLQTSCSVEEGDVFVATVSRSLCSNGLNPDFEIEGSIRTLSGEQRSVSLSVPHQAQYFCKDTFYKTLFSEESDYQPVGDQAYRSYCVGQLPEAFVPRQFIHVDRIPLTANGKVDTEALLLLDIPECTDERNGREPRTTSEKLLVQYWEELLGKDGVTIDDNFFSLGGDSIKAIQIISRLNTDGFTLEVKDIFQYPTIGDLALQLKQVEKGVTQVAVGDVPLTPIQHWGFQTMSDDIVRFTQSGLYQATSSVCFDSLSEAFHCILQHHDSLRLSYTIDTQNIMQRYQDDDSFFELKKMSFSSEMSLQEAIQCVEDRCLGTLNVNEHLLEAVVVHHGSEDYLYVVINHLLVDTVSWRILGEDLFAAYEAISTGNEASLPQKTASYQEYARTLESLSKSDELDSEQSYWEALLTSPRDRLDGSNRKHASHELQCSLPASLTATLVHQTYQMSGLHVHETILASLGQALRRVFGGRRYVVEMESHGRGQAYHSLNLSRTVGWFTSAYPILLDCIDSKDQMDALRTMKESLRTIPNDGQGYGILRYLRGALTPSAHVQADVGFNYHGMMEKESQSIEGWKSMLVDTNTSMIPKRFHALDVQAAIIDGELLCGFSISEACAEQATLERLVRAFMDSLQATIECCETISELDSVHREVSQQ